jgi:drug/metabolite transporter (DMT)-like permease
MKHSSSTITGGAMLVALSALGYATNPIFGKLAYQAGANAITLLSVRFTAAAIGLWLMLALTGKVGGIRIGKRVQLLALGGLGFGLVSLLYFTALEHIGASLATGIFYTYPAMVTVVGLFQGEGISRQSVVGLLLTMAGTWLLLGSDLGGFTWQGALLILGAAVVYTGYMIVGDRWTRNVPATVASAHVTVGASAVYLSLAFFTNQPWPVSAQAYLAGVGLAICSTMLALVTFFAGMLKVGPTRAAIISTMEPIFTALLAVLLLGERLNHLQTAGTALVVAGAVAAQLREHSLEAVEQHAA